MNTTDVLERADTFLQLRWRDSRAPWQEAPSTHTFITLSRQSGSGGTTLARRLARQLNSDAPHNVFWQIFEGNLTQTMLKENRLSSRIARYLPEDHISELNASVGELVGLHPSLWDLIQKTNRTMEKLARAGNVILVGRGANFATANIPGGIHVRLVAPAAHRARYVTQVYGVPAETAVAFNAKRDAARRRYVKSTFGTAIDDETAYNLTINTATVSLDEAAQLVTNQVRARASVGL